MATMLEELTALKSLLDQGILTQEEFDAKKAQILAENNAQTQNTHGAPQQFDTQGTTPIYTTSNFSAPQQTYVPVPTDSKSKIAAGLLAILLGSLGIHKFYLGYTQAGVIMLLVSLLGSIVIIGPVAMSIIGLIEGIIYLTKTDEQFYLTYVAGRKPWC